MCFHVEDVTLIADGEPQPLANHTHGCDGALANGEGLVLGQVPTTTWNGMKTLEDGMKTLEDGMKTMGYRLNENSEGCVCEKNSCPTKQIVALTKFCDMAGVCDVGKRLNH